MPEPQIRTSSGRQTPSEPRLREPASRYRRRSRRQTTPVVPASVPTPSEPSLRRGSPAPHCPHTLRKAHHLDPGALRPFDGLTLFPAETTPGHPTGTPPCPSLGSAHDVRVRYAHSGSRRSVTHANRRASPRKNCILSLARTLFGRTGIFCYDSATDDTRCLSGRLVTGLRHYIASPCVQVENPNHGPYLLWYIPLLPDSSSSKKC